jgi:excisionase family DNA binding protein
MRLLLAAADRVRTLIGHPPRAVQPLGMTVWGDKPWLTTSEVADELGVSADTVRRLIKDRRLRASAIAVGRARVTLRVRRGDLEAFRHAYVKDTATDDWE